MKSNQESDVLWEADWGNLSKDWRFVERWWNDNRPLRGDSYESNVARFRALREARDAILDHIEAETGIRLDPLTRILEKARQTDAGPGEGFVLWLLLAQVLGEAVAMAPRRIVSGLTGVDMYHREGHPRRGKPLPKESPEVAAYRTLRLAFYWLRRAPKRLASAVQGDLSLVGAMLPTLTGWARTRISLRKRPRLRAALKGESFEARFSGPLAVALGEHHKADRFVGKKSVLSRALKNLVKEAPEDLLHKRAAPLGSLDAQDEDDFALRLEMREALARVIERAGLTPAEKKVARLRLLEEIPNAVVASRTGQKETTVRVHWANAKKKLKTLPKEIWEVFRIS